MNASRRLLVNCLVIFVVACSRAGLEPSAGRLHAAQQAFSSTIDPENSRLDNSPRKEMRFEPSWRRPADCGPVSLYLLMRLRGRNRSIDEVFDAISIDPNSGCTLGTLAEKSAKLGFPTAIKFVNPDELASVPFPFIAHYNGSLLTGVGHFLVIVGYSPETRKFRTFNTDGEFLTWTDEAKVATDYSGYVLIPQEALEDSSMRVLGYELIGIGVFLAIAFCWRRVARRPPPSHSASAPPSPHRVIQA